MQESDKAQEAELEVDGTFMPQTKLKMSKSTEILAVVVIFLGVVYAIQRFTSRTSTTDNLKPFSSLDTANLKRVSIDFVESPGHAKGPILLDRQDGRWTITSPVNFPADEGQVSLLLSRIASNPTQSLRQTIFRIRLAYGIGSAEPVIKFQEKNGMTISCRVGDVTPESSNGCYVQITGKTEILDLASNIRTMAAQSLTSCATRTFSAPSQRHSGG